MIDSTTRRVSRFTKVLGASGVALLLLAAGCSSEVKNGDPTIHAKETRDKSGALQALTVTGKRFAPNGDVHITLLLAGGPSDASPYVEEDIKANGSGEINYTKRPVPCPQPADYGQGSYTLVTARDTASGISGSAVLNPGGAPDCKA
jgi:hypothetical protein